MYATRWIEVDVSIYHSRTARRKSEDIGLDKFDMALCNCSTGASHILERNVMVCQKFSRLSLP